MPAPLLASLMLVSALSGHSAPAALASTPIVCAPNADISSSGCGNTGAGNSGMGNVGVGNSGGGNNGTANSGTGNTGTGNSGSGNTGTGNSGCGNNGTANSGGGNTGVGNSGGNSCTSSPPPTTHPTTPPTTPGDHPGTTVIGEAGTPVHVEGQTLPLTGSSSTAPLTLAMGLMASGALAVGLANRRRHALAAATGGEVIPLSAAVGLLLTGRASGRATGRAGRAKATELKD